MRNHTEKRRDMCRSILPSTDRKNSRQNIAALKRHRRRAVRQRLHIWAGFDNAYDCELHVGDDYNRSVSYDYEGTISYLVQRRRDNDKVAPLIRWARTQYTDLDDEDRYLAFKAYLPDNLIGRHALGHIETALDLERTPRWYSRYYRSDEEREAQRHAKEIEFLDYVDGIRQLVLYGLGRFNKTLASYGFDTCAGIHDIDHFALASVRSARRSDVPLARHFIERLIAGEDVRILDRRFAA